MSRVGRKRLQGAREPNGRLSRTVSNEGRRSLDRFVNAVPAAEAKRLRDLAVAGIRERIWGSTLGQLFVTNTITASQFEAGRRWDELHRKYGFAIDARPVRSATLTRGANAVAADPNSDEGWAITERDMGIIWEFRAAHKVLKDRPAIEMRMRALCEGMGQQPDSLADLQMAVQGLDLLAKHWGV